MGLRARAAWPADELDRRGGGADRALLPCGSARSFRRCCSQARIGSGAMATSSRAVRRARAGAGSNRPCPDRARYPESGVAPGLARAGTAGPTPRQVCGETAGGGAREEEASGPQGVQVLVLSADSPRVYLPRSPRASGDQRGGAAEKDVRAWLGQAAQAGPADGQVPVLTGRAARDNGDGDGTGPLVSGPSRPPIPSSIDRMERDGRSEAPERACPRGSGEHEMGWFSKSGKHEEIPADEHWDFHVQGAKCEARKAERQRKAGLMRMAAESERVAEAHRRELKGW